LASESKPAWATLVKRATTPSAVRAVRGAGPAEVDGRDRAVLQHVERGEWIERDPEVSREVVPRSEGHDPEHPTRVGHDRRQIAHRAVSTARGDRVPRSQRPPGRALGVGGVVRHVHVEPERGERVDHLRVPGTPAAAAGGRVDHGRPAHRRGA
jgi:hypothetical protein